MVSPIQTISHFEGARSKEYTPSWISAARLKQITSAGLAALALFVGTELAVAGTLLGTAVAVPLYLVGSALIWDVFQGDGNDIDPSQVPKLRKEAKRRPIKEIMAKYGVANIFRHKLLTPELFEKKLRKLFSNMRSIVQVIRTYQKIHAKKPRGSGYRLPHPSEFSSAWHREVGSKSVTDVLDKFDLRLLHDYDIINDKACKALLEADRAWSKERKPHTPIIQRTEKAFRKKIAKDLAKFSSQFNAIYRHQSAAFDLSNTAHLRTVRKVLIYLKSSSTTHNKGMRAKTTSFLETTKMPGEPSDLFLIRMEFLSAVKKAILVRNESLRSVHKQLYSARKSLHRKYKWALS